MADIVDALVRISEAPSDEEAFNSWLGMESALELLRHNARQNEFVVYASARSTFMHAVLAPAPLLETPDLDDLMSWNCTPASSWSVVVHFPLPQARMVLH